MENEIEIKSFIRSLKISILDTKIRVANKTILKYIEFDIPLENIEHYKTVKTEINRDLIFLALVLFVFGVIFNMGGGTTIFAVLTGLCLISLLFGLVTKRRTISIATLSDSQITLSFKKGNEKTIRDFADHLINKSKQYVINKYSKVDKDLPVENQLHNIEYLRNNDLINDSKFEELKNIILNKRTDNKKVGFE